MFGLLFPDFPDFFTRLKNEFGMKENFLLQFPASDALNHEIGTHQITTIIIIIAIKMTADGMGRVDFGHFSAVKCDHGVQGISVRRILHSLDIEG